MVTPGLCRLEYPGVGAKCFRHVELLTHIGTLCEGDLKSFGLDLVTCNAG